MANVLFDAPIFRVPIVPYFGAGIGGGWNFNKFTYHVQTYTRGVIENKTSDSEGVFVYQGIAGLTLYSGRKVHASLEYRFFSGNHLAGNHAALIHVKRFF